jgi:PPOX class probable F420-dependent enzyme
MTEIPASSHGLLAEPLTAVISTVTPSGTVQSTAVWFIYDAERNQILISITDRRKKFRNLQANPNVTFFLLNPANTWQFVEIRGTATIEPDPERVLMMQIGEKHSTDVSNYDAPGQTRQRVTITPVSVNVR